MAEKTLAERDTELARILATDAMGLGDPGANAAYADGVILGALGALGYRKTVEAYRLLREQGFMPPPTQPERTDE